MKNLFNRMQTKSLAFRELLWLLVPALILIVLPVFLWAVMTQRIELRKKAASYPPPGTNPTVWVTDNVALKADSFYIYTDGKYFWGNAADIQVHSDPGDKSYTTLEAIWHEPGTTAATEMRVFMYFKSDGNTWWVNEIRTYNGKTPGDWVYYYGEFFKSPWGKYFTGTVDLTSSPNTDNNSVSTGRIHFGNMRLLPFLKYLKQPCWNLVGGSGDNLFWRNSCRGFEPPGIMCLQVITPLTADERTQYRAWVDLGRPPIPGCTFPTPTCRPRPACLDTEPRCLMPITSDMCPPVTPAPSCIPLPSCYYNKPPCEIPINGNYCPPTKPTPTPYGCFLKQVQCFQAPCPPILVCPTPTPTPYGCHLKQVQCFRAPCPPILICPTPTPVSDTQCVGKPNGTSCTLQICEVSIGSDSNGSVCRDIPGICQNGTCTAVSPSITQTPWITVYPTAPQLCTRGTPFVTVDKQSQSGAPGTTLTYQYSIKNNDSSSCGPTKFLFTGEVPTGWSSYVQASATISPGQSAVVPMLVTSSKNAQPQSYTANLVLTGNASYHYMRVPVTYTVTGQQFDQTFDFKFKFAGVTDGRAAGAKVKVHIVTPSRHLVTPDLTASYVGNAVYKVSFVTNSPLAAGDKVYFLVKGEKHAAMKFCSQVGQTTPCQASQWVTVPNPVPITWGFDFTGMPLMPGDVYPQDYITNTTDYAKIRALLKKPTSQLTAQDLLIGDLNYDGYVDVRDILLIQQTLETHFDPS